MLLDLGTRQKSSLVPTQKGMRLYGGRLSPDGKWVAFHATADHAENMTIFAAPVHSGQPGKPSEWVAIREGVPSKERRLSPKGDLLYFLSDRDGFRCVWARKFASSDQTPRCGAVQCQSLPHCRPVTEAAGKSRRFDRNVRGARKSHSVPGRAQRQYLAQHCQAVIGLCSAAVDQTASLFHVTI